MTTPTLACRRCGAPMAPGIATQATWTAGAPDFPGDEHGSTLSPGPGSVVPCWKCTECGWSVAVGPTPDAAGRQARVDGKPLSANPFNPMDAEADFMAWQDGWQDADYPWETEA